MTQPKPWQEHLADWLATKLQNRKSVGLTKADAGLFAMEWHRENGDIFHVTKVQAERFIAKKIR